MSPRGRVGPVLSWLSCRFWVWAWSPADRRHRRAGATTTVPSKAADLALARKGLLVLSDFPSGWKASGKITSGSGSNSGVPGAKLAACIGVSKTVLETNWPTENSPGFDDPTGADSVSDQVEAFPDAGQGPGRLRLLRQSEDAGLPVHRSRSGHPASRPRKGAGRGSRWGPSRPAV